MVRGTSTRSPSRRTTPREWDMPMRWHIVATRHKPAQLCGAMPARIRLLVPLVLTLTIAATGTSAETVGTKGTRAACDPKATTAIGQQTDSPRLGTSPTLSASGVLASTYVSSVASLDTPTRTVPATATTTATLSPTRRGLVRPRGTLPRPRLHQPTTAIRTVPRAKATARTRQVVISTMLLVGRRSPSTVRRRKSQAPLLRPTQETRLQPSNDAGPGSRTTPR